MEINDVVTLHFLLVGMYKAEKWRVLDIKKFNGYEFLYVEPIEGENGVLPQWIKASNFIEHPIYGL